MGDTMNSTVQAEAERALENEGPLAKLRQVMRLEQAAAEVAAAAPAQVAVGEWYTCAGNSFQVVSIRYDEAAADHVVSVVGTDSSGRALGQWAWLYQATILAHGQVALAGEVRHEG